MPARWADTLAPGKPYAETFRGLLIQRIEQDFEAEDDIVQGVIDALLEVDTKQALDAELEPIFDEGYEGISNWCWATLEQHTSKQTEPSQPETPDSSTPNSSAPTASAAAAATDEQKSQQSKRPPIRFNLDASAPDTAPKKASDSKAQQLNVGKPAKPSDPTDTKQAPGPKQTPAAEQQSWPDAQSQPARPGAAAGSSSGTAGPRQRAGAGAPAASARLLHMTGLIRPTDGGPGNSSRDSRQRGRQHEQQARLEESSKGSQPHHNHTQQQQQQQPHDRKRVLEDPHERDSRSSSRRGAAASAAAAGPGSMFRSALGGLRPDRSDRPDRSPKPQHRGDAPAVQQQQQQPQQQSGHTSVFDRINRADLARIGAPQAQQHQQQQAPAAKQQQQQLAPPIAGLPKSLQGRVGIISASTAAPAAARGGLMQVDRPQPAAGSTASLAAGSKRKASEAPQVAAAYNAAPAGAAAAAAAPANSAAASTGHLVQQTPAQQQVQGGGPAKKTRTAAPAAAAAAPAAAPGSKEAELAALRAQLQARQAEVQRLKQAQEAEQVSVAVFGVSPQVPDAVLKAHFRSCATSCGADIKRCTLLTGRYPPPHSSAPGAFLEFVGVAGDDAAKVKAAQQATTNALQLSGSMLLDQKITVVRKSEWQASVAKGQRSYAAMRSGPTAPGGSTNRSWTGPASAAAGGASAGGAGVAAAPAAGVTGS